MSLSWISAQAWTHSAHACLSTARRPRAEEEGQDDTAEASDQGDSVLPPAVPKTKFSPSATMIFAGYVDGASKACQQFPTAPVSPRSERLLARLRERTLLVLFSAAQNQNESVTFYSIHRTFHLFFHLRGSLASLCRNKSQCETFQQHLAAQVVGSCADANLSMRNALVRFALPGAPLDDSVRLLDALAAISKAEMFVANQARQ